MIRSIILFLTLNFKLLAQVGFPEYSAKLFRNDTVNLTMYCIDLPSKKKAELYSSAEMRAIQKNVYSSDSDTIGKDWSPEEQKRNMEEFKNQLLEPEKYLKVMYYFIDLNQDHQLDIIKVYSDLPDRPDSTLKTRYPSAQDDNVTFFISTKSKYYNKYIFPGRLNSLEKMNNEFCFTCISSSCCDESVTRIDKFNIPVGASEFKREYSIWTEDEYDWSKPEGYYLPANFIHPESYLLNEDQVLCTGVYHCQGGGRMSILFEKDDNVRILSEKGAYYFVEFEVKKNSNECVLADNIYFLRWWKKANFKKIARKTE